MNAENKSRNQLILGNTIQNMYIYLPFDTDLIQNKCSNEKVILKFKCESFVSPAIKVAMTTEIRDDQKVIRSTGVFLSLVLITNSTSVNGLTLTFIFSAQSGNFTCYI